MVGMTFSRACSNTGSGPCLVLVSISSSAPYTMDSAADFLPSYMIEFMNFVMTMFPNFGSGFTSRFSAEWRRDIDQIPDYFGRFAPYLERRCLRFLTPWVSRTPRRMW